MGIAGGVLLGHTQGPCTQTASISLSPLTPRHPTPPTSSAGAARDLGSPATPPHPTLRPTIFPTESSSLTHCGLRSPSDKNGGAHHATTRDMCYAMRPAPPTPHSAFYRLLQLRSGPYRPHLRPLGLPNSAALSLPPYA